MKREQEEPKVKVATQPIPCWLVGTYLAPHSESFFSETNQDIFEYGDILFDEKINLEEELKEIVEKFERNQDPDISSLQIYSSFSGLNLAKVEFLDTIEEAKAEGLDIHGVSLISCQLPTGAEYAKLPNGLFISNRINIVGVVDSYELEHEPEFDLEEDSIDPDIIDDREDKTEKKLPVKEFSTSIEFTVPEGWKIGNIDRQIGGKIVVSFLPIKSPANFEELTLEMEREHGDLENSSYGMQEERKVECLQQLIRTAAYMNYLHPQENPEEIWTISLGEDDDKLTVYPKKSEDKNLPIVWFNTKNSAIEAVHILGEDVVKSALKNIIFLKG